MAADSGRLTPCRLRRMTGADLDLVVANAAKATTYPWSRRNFADSLQAGHECWLAECDGAATGHGVLASAGDVAELLDVCVLPAAQRRGIGRALVRHLLHRAEVRGASTVFLEVRVGNAAARGLYAGMGFQQVGRRRNYYPAPQAREDALLLERPVGVRDEVPA